MWFIIAWWVLLIVAIMTLSIHVFIVSLWLLILGLMSILKVKHSTQIIVITILLMIFGIFALYSVSIYESFDQTLKRINRGVWEWEPSNYYYFNEQIKNILIALIPVSLVAFIPVKTLKKPSIIVAIAIGAIILQLLVFVPWIGIELNGARWWLRVPGIGTIQPAEFFKVWLVVFLSSWLLRKQHLLHTTTFFVWLATILGIVFILFLFIPDVGAILVMAIIALIMTRFAWAKIKHLLAICIAGLVVSLSIIGLVPSKFGYITDRLNAYTTIEWSDELNQWVKYQTVQALVGIWWGWTRWQGYGKGLQKFGRIPEAQSDFLFAALSEEIWFVGNMYIVLLYFLLAYHTMIAISSMRDPQYKLISIGIISLIIVQAFVNIGVNSNIIPNTWLTLPFMSYGWTALMINLIEITLLYKFIENKR